jgi:hypothetical protein
LELCGWNFKQNEVKAWRKLSIYTHFGTLEIDELTCEPQFEKKKDGVREEEGREVFPGYIMPSRIINVFSSNIISKNFPSLSTDIL